MVLWIFCAIFSTLPATSVVDSACCEMFCATSPIAFVRFSIASFIILKLSTNCCSAKFRCSDVSPTCDTRPLMPPCATFSESASTPISFALRISTFCVRFPSEILPTIPCISKSCFLIPFPNLKQAIRDITIMTTLIKIFCIIMLFCLFCSVTRFFSIFFSKLST